MRCGDCKHFCRSYSFCRVVHDYVSAGMACGVEVAGEVNV